MHKTLILLSLLAISGLTKLTQYQELSPLWSSWKTIHQKEYSAAEDDVRYAIFVDNYHKITKHNAEHSNPRLGLTKFADLTFEEFRNLYSECSHTTRPNSDDRQTIPYELIKAPDSVDWRNGNYVTPVKNQGQCGSCWTFAATGALEGFYAIHQGQLLSFSEQQLVDCSTDAPNSGCNGGNAGVAIDYAAQNGMAQEDQYPYTAQDGYCSYQGGGVRVNSGAADVTHNSVDALKSAIATQPTTVAVEVNDMFQHYTGGIIDGSSGCGANTNHAVLAVGYGRIDGQNEAFIIKNSWGEGWGDRGYVYLSTDGGANGGAGVCGVLTYPVVVT